MKKYGATGVRARAGKAAGLRGDGQRIERDPGRRVQREDVERARTTRTRWKPDALTAVGHQGFVVDAQAMAALLFDFATRADYRAVGQARVRHDQGRCTTSTSNRFGRST